MITFVFARLEDTVSLWRTLGDKLRPALTRYDTVMREALGQAGGYEVKRESSTFLYAFQRPEGALRAALSAQQTVIAEPWHQTVPELVSPGGLPAVRVAIGVHTGSAIQRLDPLTGRTDFLGPAVNAAARIGQVARGLQILVSQEALQAAADGGFNIEDPEREGAWMALHGAQLLRGVTQPVELVELRPQSLARAVVSNTPSVRSLTAGLPMHNLPPSKGSFVGRSAEMVLLEATVGAGEQLIVLTGPGGAGKSRTATEVARSAISGRTGRRFPGGGWFIDLGASRTLEELCAAMARALHIPVATGGDPALYIGNHLRALGPAVLVLDEADDVVELLPTLGQGWRLVAPDTVFLVTSRLAIHLPGVRVVTILPLPTPPPHTARSSLRHNPALQLLFDRIRERSNAPWESVPDGFIDAAAELVRRLDGLPLAVELAADVLAALDAVAALDQILAWNRYGLAELAVEGPGAPQIRHLLERTWTRLPMWARVATAQASVFRGPFSVDAAEAVILLVGVLGAPAPLDALELLADLNLILPAGATDGGESLLQVPTLVSAFVLPRTDVVPPTAPASVTREGAERRHLMWYAHQGGEEETEKRRGERAGAELQRLHLERENLWAALRRAARTQNGSSAVGVARALVDLMDARGPLDRVDEVVDVILNLPDAQPEEVADLVVEATTPMLLAGRTQKARAALARGMSLVNASPDETLRARLALAGAAVFADQGLPDRALSGATRASELARQAADERTLAACWQMEAQALRQIGRTREGLDRAELASSLASTLGEPLLWAEASLTLGRLMMAEGRANDARTRLNDVVQRLRRLGRLRLAASGAVFLAEVNLTIGRGDEAEALLKQAIPALGEAGDRTHLKRGFEQLARVLQRAGRHGEAQYALNQATSLGNTPTGRAELQQYAPTTTRVILAPPKARS